MNGFGLAVIAVWHCSAGSSATCVGSQNSEFKFEWLTG